MRVTFLSYYGTLNTSLNSLNTEQQKAQQQISTGQKLTVPSDDPNAMQRVLDQRTEKAQINQYWQNASDITSISKASTNDLQQLHTIYTTVSGITTQGSSQLTDATSMKAYASQTDQLLEQALTEANSKYNGAYLHGGTATNTPPFVAVRDPATNQITSVNYVGNATSAQVSISATTTVSPYTNGSENTNIQDFLNNMVSLRNGLQAADAVAVKALVPAQVSIEDNLLSSISRAGAVQYRMQVTQAQATQNYQAADALISKDADADFATATVQLNRAQTAYSAAVQSGAKIANTSLLNYIQ